MYPDYDLGLTRVSPWAISGDDVFPSAEIDRDITDEQREDNFNYRLRSDYITVGDLDASIFQQIVAAPTPTVAYSSEFLERAITDYIERKIRNNETLSEDSILEDIATRIFNKEAAKRSSYLLNKSRPELPSI